MTRETAAQTIARWWDDAPAAGLRVVAASWALAVAVLLATWLVGALGASEVAWTITFFALPMVLIVAAGLSGVAVVLGLRALLRRSRGDGDVRRGALAVLLGAPPVVLVVKHILDSLAD